MRNPFGLAATDMLALGDRSPAEPYFDFEAFKRVVEVQVRMLDNVLDATYWPLPEQLEQSQQKRRIGVGFTGLGNALTMLKLKYNSSAGRGMARNIARIMRDTAYIASVKLAQEKGAFPAFNADKYLEEGTFASRLPPYIQEEIRQHGIRNSHLLSIAPTGTVSLAFADNASNGIEPAFSWFYTRKKRAQNGEKIEYQVEDHAWRLYKHLGGDVDNLPEYFVNALTMSAMDHLSMMAEVQPYIDTAISKTVNIPADYPFDDFKDLYTAAWKGGLKGLATYRPNDTLGSVLSVEPTKKEETKAPVPEVDPMVEMIARRPEGLLPAEVHKLDYNTSLGQQRLYLVISYLPLPDGRHRAIEFFMPVGQNGESQQWIASSMRLLSLAARGGFLDRALRDMCKVAWDKGPVRLGWHYKEDGSRVPKWHDSEAAAIAFAIQEAIKNRNATPTAQTPALAPAASAIDSLAVGGVPVMKGKKCPECGAHALIKKDGCEQCTECGHLGSCG